MGVNFFPQNWTQRGVGWHYDIITVFFGLARKTKYVFKIRLINEIQIIPDHGGEDGPALNM